jgi:hypothetical protein
MYDSWTCLSVEKGPGTISDEVRNTLKAAACDLYLKKWDEMRLENDLVSGTIKTEWDTHMVGGRSGVLFRAQVDCEDGTDYKVNFLFNKKDLEQGAQIIRQMEEHEGGDWADAPARIPCPELYRFYDLRGPSRRLH